MAIASPYEKYQQQSVMTAAPGDLTLMLYNGSIKFINRAKLDINAKDIEKASNAIIRSQNIIGELISSLNPEYEISKNLRALYDFMLRNLVEANISKDISLLDETLGLITELRDTWVEAIKINRRQVYGG